MKKIAVFMSAVIIGASLCALVNAQTKDNVPTAAPIQEQTTPAPADKNITPVADKNQPTSTQSDVQNAQPTAQVPQENLSEWVEIGRDSFFNLQNFEYSDDGLIGYWVKLGKNNALKAVESNTSEYENYFLVSNCKNNTISYLDKILYDKAGNVIGKRRSGSDFPNVAKNPSQYIFEAVKPESTEEYIQNNACLVYNYVKEKGNTFNRADLAKLFTPTRTGESITTTKTVKVSDIYPMSENPNWHKIAENKYFDLSSVKATDKGISTVWVKEYNDGSFDLIDTKKVLYNMSLVQYDCANKKTKVLKSVDYDLNQKVIRDFDYSNFALWKVSKDKNSDLEYAFLCTLKKDMK